ncbi:MAG: hypothetical protein ABIC82_01380 [bacterium]
MKNLKNKINFLFCFSVVLFFAVISFHFLIINKKTKEAQAAGVLSIAGVTGLVMPCSLIPLNCGATCSVGTAMVSITQIFGGDKLVTPVICIPPPPAVFLVNGKPLTAPGVTFLGGFITTSPVAVQSGYTGSY